MTRDVEPTRISAEARGVLVNPGDGTAHLVRHRPEAVRGVLHPHKVGNHVMRPGVDEHLGWERIVFGQPAAPGAAVNEDMDGRVGAFGRINIELLDLRWAVGVAPGCADAGTRRLAVGGKARGDLPEVRRVDALVVSIIEFRLVVVEEHARPFDAGRGCRLGESEPGRGGDGASARAAYHRTS